MSNDKRLFLLDAMALIYRAYFAMIRSPRVTSYGKNTNAQYGFTNTLLELINKEKPSHLAVVFDTKADTVRHEDFADYKANREAAPDDLILSLPDIKKIISGFNIPCIELDGYEADDLIGTLAWQASDLGYTVYMVTPDKDYGQLVRGNVFMYKPASYGQGHQVLDVQKVCEKWDIKRVDQVVDLLGLMGDASDNIPGIKGVGEKTAAKLLATYDTLENVLEHAHEIKGALGEKVRNGKESALLSKRLATIITNAPITFNEEYFLLSEWNNDSLKSTFENLEFKTLSKRLFNTDVSNNDSLKQKDLFGNTLQSKEKIIDKEIEPISAHTIQQNLFDLLPQQGNNIHNTTHQYTLLSTDDIDSFVLNLQQQKTICFDTETTSIDANKATLVGISFSWNIGEAYYLPISEDVAKAKETLEKFNSLWHKQELTWVGHNIKYDLLILKWYGITIQGLVYDTMIAHYIIDPDAKQTMDTLSARYLNYEPIHIEELIGPKGKSQKNMRDVAIEIVKEYAAEDADITLQLKSKFDKFLSESNFNYLLDNIENPLVKVLVDMEFNGVAIDIPFLEKYSEILSADIKLAEENVYKEAGLNFNLASPKQLGEVLFEHLKLDAKAKKTKTGQYATGEDILQKLRNKHKIIDDILNFRELSKLKNTYVDTLPSLVNSKSGRVHTSFNQAVVVTGRLSSNNPNLQNIPIKSDRGREIRKAFIPQSKNHMLISADYSQIELRIIASLSGDHNMINAFIEGKDIHTATASKVYNVDEIDVTQTMRRNAKAVNFGIIYGQSAFGLSESLGISRSEAKEIIDTYFTQFSGIKNYIQECIKRAQSQGFVQTITGRKRMLPDINNANQFTRGFAERNAINMPIQGSAADMIKLAMIAIQDAIIKNNLQTKMILQVHDELVFDSPIDEIEAMKSLIVNKMENALQLPHSVPVKVSCGVGNNWLEAH